MAKYGSVSTQLINVTCPYCFQDVENGRGSIDLHIGDDIDWDRETKIRFVVCQCGKRVNVGNKASC